MATGDAELGMFDNDLPSTTPQPASVSRTCFGTASDLDCHGATVAAGGALTASAPRSPVPP